MALNSNSSRNLHLPDIHQHGPNLAFGINQRGLLEANSDLQNQAAFRNRNQSMTLEEVMQLGGKGVGPTVAAYALLGKQKTLTYQKDKKTVGATTRKTKTGGQEGKQRGWKPTN